MHASPTRPLAPPSATPAIVLALVLLAGLATGGAVVLNQGRTAPGTSIPKEALAAVGDSGPSGSSADAKPLPQGSGPGWEVMTTPQKLALYPLAERWAYLSEAQKRYWLTIAQTFGAMPEAEQARLHQRMTAWASLSAQQRSQARLNFAVTRGLAPHDILAEWETYQALSEAEKQRLAARAAKPKGAATALKPVPSKRLTHVPGTSDAQASAANPPKIVLPATSAVRPAPLPAPVALPPAPPLPLEDEAALPPLHEPPPDEASKPPPLPPIYLN